MEGLKKRGFASDNIVFGIGSFTYQFLTRDSNADALIAFWDGKSRGTKHMIDLAKKHNLQTRIVRY